MSVLVRDFIHKRPPEIGIAETDHCAAEGRVLDALHLIPV